jgi:hypothetical protein
MRNVYLVVAAIVVLLVTVFSVPRYGLWSVGVILPAALALFGAARVIGGKTRQTNSSTGKEEAEAASAGLGGAATPAAVQREATVQQPERQQAETIQRTEPDSLQQLIDELTNTEPNIRNSPRVRELVRALRDSRNTRAIPALSGVVRRAASLAAAARSAGALPADLAIVEALATEARAALAALSKHAL